MEVADVVFLGLTVALFALMVLLVKALDRL
jgi:hypothetical protein